jgi:hypothetical protein
MKGTKGMQKGLYLFLASSLAAASASSAQSSRRAGVAAYERRPLSFSSSKKIITLEELELQAPNVAFIPDPEDAISYENILLGVAEPALAAAPAATLMPMPAPEKEEKKIVAAKPVPKPALKSVAKSVQTPRGKNDKFSGVRVGEGEEVLVSVYRAPASAFVLPAAEESGAKSQRAAAPAKETGKASDTAQASKTTETEAPAAVASAPAVPAEGGDEPFGVVVSSLLPDETDVRIENQEQFAEVADRATKRPYVTISQAKPSPFMKAFSAMKPDEKKKKKKDAQPAPDAPPSAPKAQPQQEKQVSSLSPMSLKEDLYRTYISENRYLSPVEYLGAYEEYAEPFHAPEAAAALDIGNVASRVKEAKTSILVPGGSLKVGGREVLQMKLEFEPTSSAVTGESVNIMRSFAQIATDQPTNSIEVGIPESVMSDPKKKRLTARRLAIVSNVLRSSGLSEKQVYPVLTSRDENSFSFRVIGNDAFDTIRVAKSYDPFGDDENMQEYNLMRW